MNEVIVYALDTNRFSEFELKRFVSLSNADLEFVSKYKEPKSYKEHLASMYLKRKYVGDFYIGENEKPLAKSIYFNVSHSNGLVVLAVSKDHEIGIDIEIIREVKNDLKRYVTNDSEYQSIKSNEDFFRIWTSKESLLKCIGTGLKDIKNVPAMPFDGKKSYLGKTYFSHLINLGCYLLSITMCGANFNYSFIPNEETMAAIKEVEKNGKESF